jgi:small multidrug resistance pump
MDLRRRADTNPINTGFARGVPPVAAARHCLPARAQICQGVARQARSGTDARTWMPAYPSLIVAIVAEVIATTALAQSASFTRLGPSIVTVIGYSIAFVFLSFALRVMPTGVVYAIWSGLGIVLIALVSWIWAKQSLDWPALLGLGLILSGVLVINLFSDTVGH